MTDLARYVGWHWGTWESPSILSGKPRFDFRSPPAEATAFVSRADCDRLTLAERLSDLYSQVWVNFADSGGNRRFVTKVRCLPELLEAGITWRTLIVDGGVLTQSSAEAFANFLLDLAERQTRVAGGATLPAMVGAVGGDKPAYLLRPGIDMLGIPDIPAYGPALGAEGARRSSFHLKRVETTAGREGAQTDVEFGSGADLLEVLQARVEAVTAIAGGR